MGLSDFDQNKYSDVADFITEFLQIRRVKNPRYSMRAFARDVGIAPGRMSEILSGKKLPGKILIEKISSALNLDQAQKEQLIYITGRHKNQRKDGREIHPMTDDTFTLLPEWQHFAILNLMDTSTFQPKATWIAQRLNLTTESVEDSLQKLLKAGLVEKHENFYRQTHQHLVSTNEIPSAALKKYHRQMMEKSLWSLENDPVSVREITSLIVTANPQNLYKLKLLAKEFRRQACEILEEGDKTEVYNICMQIVPATVITVKEETP